MKQSSSETCSFFLSDSYVQQFCTEEYFIAVKVMFFFFLFNLNGTEGFVDTIFLEAFVCM